MLAEGHDAILLTNYPKSVCARYGIPPERVVNCLWHGVMMRAWIRLPGFMQRLVLPWVHRLFGQWASRQLAAIPHDVAAIMSGVAEEALRNPGIPSLKIVIRTSAHIEEQAAILEAEERRAGVPIDRPGSWMIARELREYSAADRIWAPSSFVAGTFAARGIHPPKVFTALFGEDAPRFRLSENDACQRERRSLAGEPLQVLTVGNFSFQKGALDYAAIAQNSSGTVRFRFVGHVLDECRPLAAGLRDTVLFTGRVPEHGLKQHYAWADIFLFPTIQDGFAVVITQAIAAGLPVLATTNCAAPDLVREGETGWILPIRDPATAAARLHWCATHRLDLTRMQRQCAVIPFRTWPDAARDFVAALA